jgi:hypothetical protein
MKLLLDPDEMLSNHHLERGLPGSRARGGALLKIRLFLSFHKNQAPIIKISMKKG